MASDPVDPGLPDRVMKRAQWRLLPLLFTAYLIAIVDRANISFAAETMNRDLGFSASVYGFAGGIFFVSYALLEVPSSALMMRFGTRIWVARIMISWGLISVAQLFVTTPMQFYALRFLLGAAEAGFFPSILFYASLWFPAQWRSRIVSRFYVAQPFSQVVLGLASGPLLGLHGELGLSGWQWLLLMEALPAILMGLVIFRWLPDTPDRVAWLSEPERNWLNMQLSADAQAITTTRHHSLMAAISDRRLLLLGLIWFLFVGAVNAYLISMPQIIAVKTGLAAGAVGQLTAAGGVLGVIMLLGLGWSSDRRQERFWHMLLPWTLLTAAFAALTFNLPAVIAIMAILVIALTNMPSQSVFLAALSEQLHERHRAAGVAAVNTFGQFASFLSTSGFGVLRDATGSYDAGLAITAICLGISVLLLNGLRKASVKPPRMSSPH